MMSADGVFIGQLCHIEAAEPGGERFNANMTNEQRRSAPNLMLMCYPHHQETNNVALFPVGRLKEMKSNHERRFAQPNKTILEWLAHADRVALTLGGMVAGLGIRGLTREVGSAVNDLKPETEHRRRLTKRVAAELKQVLRLGPRGTIWYFSRSKLHLDTGRVFLEVFRDTGWKVSEVVMEPDPSGELEIDYRNCMSMWFFSKDEYQLPTMIQTVKEFFQKAGFVESLSANEVEARMDDAVITFRLGFGQFPDGMRI